MRLRYAIYLCTLPTEPACKNPPENCPSFCCMRETPDCMPTVLDCEEPRVEVHLNTYKGEIIIRLT